MKALDRIGVISANLAAAALGALLFKALGLPLATILGSLTGAALAANLVGAPPGAATCGSPEEWRDSLAPARWQVPGHG